MKKVLKYGAIAIGVLIVVGLAVPFLIPTDTYKKLVVNEVEKRLSAKIELSSMRIRFIPLPGFTLNDVKLTNTTGAFAGQTLVAAKEISGSVELTPLFSKNAVVSLKLMSPEVYYSSDKNGRTNIEDLLDKDIGSEDQEHGSTSSISLIPSAFAEENKGPETPKPAVPAASEWKVMVTGLEIDNGLARISKYGEPIKEIKRLDVKLSNFSPTFGKATAPVHLAAALFGSDKQNLKIDGKIGLNTKSKDAEIKEMKLTVGSAEFRLSAKANYSDPLSAELSLSLPKATVGNLLDVDPKIIAQFPKDISATALSKTPISMTLDGDFKNSVVNVKKLSLALGGTKLSASGTVRTAGDMQLSLAAKLLPVKVEELKAILPALAPIGSIADPAVSLKVDGPAANLKKLSLAGHVETKKVRYQDYEISDLNADVKYGGNKIALSNLTGSLYGGALKGSGSLLMAAKPAYEADVNISNVDMSLVPATKELLKGKGTLDVTASGEGTDTNDIKKNLKAKGSINLANGDIPSLKLGEKIFGSPAWNILAAPGIIINQQGLNELRSLDASCKDFSATFSVDDGVITTPSVKWQHAKYRVQLSGSVSMDEQLDYKGEFTLLKPSTTIIIKNEGARRVLANSSGELAIPFNVGGTVSSPSVRPDEKYLASLFTKAVTAGTAGRAVEAVKDAVGIPKNTGKKILQGIFGR